MFAHSFCPGVPCRALPCPAQPSPALPYSALSNTTGADSKGGLQDRTGAPEIVAYKGQFCSLVMGVYPSVETCLSSNDVSVSTSVVTKKRIGNGAQPTDKVE
jgi:hypothetical protein